ncbi:MAG: rhomboid family intramembrane serine protease [Pirellulaceae bacterium]
MGIEDRGYYREQDQQSLFRGMSVYSMVTMIIIANVVFYFIEHISRDVFEALSLKVELLSKPWQFPTLLTYGFVHAPLKTDIGISHILFNMLTLFFLGRSVEDHVGKKEFLIFYLVAIVFSGLVWVIDQGLILGHDVGLVSGASGAVTAVVMLFVFLFPKQTILIFGVIPMPAWLLGVLLVLGDMRHAFSPNSPVAVDAHLAGAAFAAVYHWSGMRFAGIGNGLAWNWKRRRSGLKVHRPKIDAKWERLQQEGDRILSKISEQGEESLTSKERKTLAAYSEQLRKRRE